MKAFSRFSSFLLSCSILLVANADAAATEPVNPRFMQLHRVFATETDKIDSARMKYPNSFRDGLIVATFVGLKIGKPEVREFPNHRDFSAHFKATGTDVQICISSTIGHKDEWTFENDMPKMVGSDGTVAKNNACPRAPQFISYVCDVFRRYAALKPSVIWFDDDFRMPHHTPVDCACFCDSCLASFEKETGIRLSRKELVNAIRTNRSVGGVNVRRAWRDYSSRALTDIVSAAADAVHKVDDSISIGYMVCNPGGLGYAPPDFKTWIEKGRNKDGIVYFRHGSGVYTDFMPYDKNGVLAKNIAIGRLCAMTEGPGVVNLTEEVTSPYNRRTKSMKMTFLEVALNLGFAGADGVTYDAIKPNLDEQLRDDAVVAEMHRRDPELQMLHSLVHGKRQVGIYPFFDVSIWLENDAASKIRDMRMLGADDWRPLACLGIPFTFREKYASLLLLSGKSARGMQKAHLERWLGRGVVADGAAAKVMDRICGRNVSSGDKVAVFCKDKDGCWSNDVWGREASLRIKGRLDRLCGGKLPSRVDTVVRLAQSTWDSPDGKDRVVFLFNMDFDDSTDAVLRLDGKYKAEVLDARTGSFSQLGVGDSFKLPVIPAWSPLAVRLTKCADMACVRVSDRKVVDEAIEFVPKPFRIKNKSQVFRAIEAGEKYVETDCLFGDACQIPLHDFGIKTIYDCTNIVDVQAAVELGAKYIRTREPEAVVDEIARVEALRGRPVRRREFRIRDPYVYADPDTKTYYLYETKSPYFYAPYARGVNVRTSKDLETWSPLKEVMSVPTNLHCRTVWAPEVHKYNGAYYLFTTLTFHPSPDDKIPVLSDDPNWKPKDTLQPVRRGTWVYKANSPLGPFEPVSDGSATPHDWMALDGTLLVDDDKPYMVFCHEWVQTKWGRIDVAEMAPDLSCFVQEPKVLFESRATGPGGGHVTDGCFCYRSPKTGKLYMIWSPFYKKNYTVFCCESESGRAEGPWVNQHPIFEKNGGHGMLFRTFDGRLKLVLHQPERRGYERLAFFDVDDTESGLVVRQPEPGGTGRCR